MEAIELLRLRRSIRAFENRPIDRDLLEKIIDAGRFAPTARNVQPWEFVVVTESRTLKAISELAENGRFISQAKACIAVFCSDTKYYLEDGCAATMNILLAAAALGVGSCWVAGDKKPYCLQVSELLDVPKEFKLVSLIALGYPQENSAFKIAEKKPLKQMLHWEKFNK
jgi:nitroreductase